MNGRAMLWVILAAVILAVFVPVVSAEFADHVVISEVQIKQDEFVELYNPTDDAIDMTGWYWCYFSPGQDWNESNRCKEFPDGTTVIHTHGYYLIGLHGYDILKSDWQPYDSKRLGDNKGSVAIFPWDPREKTVDEAKTMCIDAVGWKQNDQADDPIVHEGAPTSNPDAGKSMVRKTDATGVDPLYGNAWDTDNNSDDFVLQVPNPQNSSGISLPPLPEPSVLTLISVGLILFICISGFKRLNDRE